MGEVDPLAEQPLVGSRSHSDKESTGKRTRTHGGPDGKILNRHLLVEMCLQPCNRVREQVGAVKDWQWILDVLGLAAVALWRHDQLTSEPGGDLAPVVLADDMQAEIDGCRAAGRREDVALIDEEHARVD